MSTQARGRVILLNGASSSGKGSIGRALLPLLPDPWFVVPVDGISGMRSTVHTRQLTEDEIAEMLTKTRRGYHRVVAALASVGNDVIMDYPLSEPWRLADLLEVLTGYDVTLVDVHCSDEELERRERARKGSTPGPCACRSPSSTTRIKTSPSTPPTKPRKPARNSSRTRCRNSPHQRPSTDYAPTEAERCEGHRGAPHTLGQALMRARVLRRKARPIWVRSSWWRSVRAMAGVASVGPSATRMPLGLITPDSAPATGLAGTARLTQ